MSEKRSEIRFYSLEEANQALPKLRRVLAALRSQKKEIMQLQAKVDIEEMTGPANQEEIARLLQALERGAGVFRDNLKEIHDMGVELKDLDKGLFDFYSLRENKVIFLCWKDGEDKISHWHGLEEGYSGRRKI